MTLICGYALLDLGLQAGVLRQQRRIAVGRTAGDDLEMTGVLQRCKRADNVAPAALLEICQSVAVPIVPPPGEIRHVKIAFVLEPVLVLLRGGNLAAQVAGQLILKTGIAQLLHEHGSQAERDLGRHALGDETAADIEQGQVRFGGGLGQPIRAVRGASVRQHVRNMRVQNERKCA